jgi:capsular exopolysaccharide synthesis family protein
MTNGLMGVLIGFVLSLVVAFIVETFDTSLGAIEEVEETLGTQVVGVVPQTDWADVQGALSERFPGALKGHSQRHAINLISHYCVSSMMTESFRALRTSLEFRDVERRLKTILVTSTSPQEGKTLVAANLAMMMAQSGKKTLLIGSDLRKPSVSRIFGVESTPGLTDVLLGNYHWRDTVKTIVDLALGHMTFEEVTMTPRLDNLHLIAGGSIPPDPTELIDSARFAEFIREAKEEYQILILDAPPLLSASDAMIMGTKVDGVLLVYRIGSVPRGLLRRASRQLEQVRSHLIGVVLNGMRPDVSPDFDHCSQYRYYSSYASDGEDKKMSEQAGEGGHKVIPELSWKAKLATIRQGLSMEPHSVLKIGLLLAAMGLLGAGILRHNGNVSFAGRTEFQPAYRAPVKLEQSRFTVSSAASGDSARVSKNEASAHEGSERSFREEITSVLQPAESPEKESGRYPFSVCLGSFPNRGLSKKATLQYDKQGIPPFVVEVRLNKGTWYRVYTGYFERREEGNEYIEAKGLQGAKVIETPWANLIGIYSSPSELQERTKLLHDLDYSPYVVKDEDGKARLYLGAFNERDRAQGMQEELTSKGIESRIVKR